MRSTLSIARPFPDNFDEEIRNAVEGFASELAVAEAGERSFSRWWEQAAITDLQQSHHLSRSAFISGYVAAARDRGQLPGGVLA